MNLILLSPADFVRNHFKTSRRHPEEPRVSKPQALDAGDEGSPGVPIGDSSARKDIGPQNDEPGGFEMPSTGTLRVRLTDRRFRHIVDTIKPKLGVNLIVGLESVGSSDVLPLAGLIGKGRVVSLTQEGLELDVTLETPPPPKLPVTLCVALMRPPVLRRVLQTASTMGVAEIHFFHSRRVEKSFWQSTSLGEAEIRQELMLGLEQAKDTILPLVSLHKRFKPFVEDVLPGLLKGRKTRDAGRGTRKEVVGLVADPSGEPVSAVITREEGRRTRDEERKSCSLSSIVRRPPSFVVILGPEGGFIPYEIEKFKKAGCRVVSLGERTLRVETAVVAMLAKMS